MIGDRVLIGASAGPGVAGLQVVEGLRLGNCVLCDLPNDLQEGLAMARFCRERQIVLFLSELVFRGSKDLWRPSKQRLAREECLSREEINSIIAEAGEWYGGRMTIGESGGVLYWPKHYLRRGAEVAFVSLPECETMLEAREAYVEYLKDFIDFERESVSDGPLMNVDSSLVFKYHAEAGIDVFCHEALPGDPHRMQAAIRGAARAYGKPWGTHIAMGWYGGVTVDKLWMKRWKSSVYHCYLTGSEFIYPESGHLALTEHQTQKRYEPLSEEMREARRILREAYQFSLVHTRPAGGPKVRLGIVYGYGDGAPGLWNPYAWGQTHEEKWLAGAPEAGWELVDGLHRREEWSNYSVQGEVDWSGNPPYGQYDIVPIEAEVEVLKRYGCLVFVGWNTMTEEIYGKLKEYVAGGGRLLMFLPQLREDADRGAKPVLYANGDFSDLFGVRVTGKGTKDVRGVKFLAQSSVPEYRLPVADVQCDPRFLGNFTPAGLEVTTARVLVGHDVLFGAEAEQLARQPVVVENKVGDGLAMLVTLFEYPADEAVVGLTRELLRVVSAGEQGEVRVLGSDRVRWAVYEAPEGAQVLYLLNTDPDCAAPVRVWVEGRLSEEFTVPANEMVVAYRLGEVLVVAEDKCVELQRWEGNEGEVELSVYSVRGQALGVHSVGDEARVVKVNGTAVAVGAGEAAEVEIERREAPGGAGYAEDFLVEPELGVEIDPKTSY
ncbi:MAG: hypothetical protein ABFE08_12880 [Armatimonadia bacterium]